MGKLEGKVALITGAGQGIGQGIALALAKEGAVIAVAGRTESKLHTTCGLLADIGARGEAVVCDVSKKDDITDAWTVPSNCSAESTSWSTTPTTASPAHS